MRPGFHAWETEWVVISLTFVFCFQKQTNQNTCFSYEGRREGPGMPGEQEDALRGSHRRPEVCCVSTLLWDLCFPSVSSKSIVSGSGQDPALSSASCFSHPNTCCESPTQAGSGYRGISQCPLPASSETHSLPEGGSVNTRWNPNPQGSDLGITTGDMYNSAEANLKLRLVVG